MDDFRGQYDEARCALRLGVMADDPNVNALDLDGANESQNTMCFDLMVLILMLCSASGREYPSHSTVDQLD